MAINSNYTTRKVLLRNPSDLKWELQLLLKVIAYIEILEQFNKTDSYLALYAILVKQELRI